MTAKKKIVCWLLLPVILFWFCNGFGVSTAGAFYRDTTDHQTAVWDTFMQAVPEVSSDCLVPGGQIVLLGEIDAVRWIAIHVQSDSTVLPEFTCRVTESQLQDYVSVGITEPTRTDIPGEMLVNLLVMPTEAANNLSADVQVDILVTFIQGNAVLEGTFRLVLPAGHSEFGQLDELQEDAASAAADTISIEEPEVPLAYMFGRTALYAGNSGNLTGNTNSGPNDDPYDIGPDTEIIPVIPPGPNPEQPPVGDEETGPNDDPYDIGPDTEIIIPIPDPGPSPDPEQPPVEDGETEPDDDPYVINPDTEITPILPPAPPVQEPDDDPYVIDPDTEITPILPPEEPNDDPYDITSDTEITPLPVKELSFHFPENSTLGMVVPIVFELPIDCSSVEVSCVGGDLPPFTRYSPDGGLTWYLLYYGGTIDVEIEELSYMYMDERCLLLDLSQTYLSGESNTEVTVRVNTPEAVYEGNLILCPEMTFFGETNTSMVLVDGGAIVVPQSQSSTNCSNQLFLEQLVSDGTSASYVSVPAEQINVTFYDGVIEISGDARLLPAGTYRLTILYLYGGVILSQSQITFFVNRTAGTRWG